MAICDNVGKTEAGILTFAGRNTVELAEKYGVPTLDYYSVIKAHTEWLSPRDGVHLAGEGSRAIGKLAVAEIQKIVKG